jgi:hypothetical protein
LKETIPVLAQDGNPKKTIHNGFPEEEKHPKREVLLLGLPHCTGYKVIGGHSVEGSFILLTGDINDMIPIPNLTLV